jgi:CRP/FNR family transcriptional regulator
MNASDKHLTASVPPAWLNDFPELAEINDRPWLDAIAHGRMLTLPKDAIAFKQNGSCDHYLLVLEGWVRVQQVSSQGREIMLYRVGPSQVCVLTVACLLSGRAYCAQGVTESEVRVMAIPRQFFLPALNAVPSLQRYVFSLFSDKLLQVVGMFEQLAFGSVEVRLARHLIEQAGPAALLRTTHEKLAKELGTDRVVVSRLMKDFERKKLLRCGRGSVELSDRSALEGFLAAHPI